MKNIPEFTQAAPLCTQKDVTGMNVEEGTYETKHASARLEATEPRNASASRHTPNRRRSQVLDPFAIKISIPPLVLLGYVIYRWYMDTDIRKRRIHTAEIRHSELMAEMSDEATTSRILKGMS